MTKSFWKPSIRQVCPVVNRTVILPAELRSSFDTGLYLSLINDNIMAVPLIGGDLLADETTLTIPPTLCSAAGITDSVVLDVQVEPPVFFVMRRPRVRRCQPWPLLGGRKYLEVEPFSTLAPPHNQAEVRKMKRAMTSISYMMELEADGKVIIPGRLQKPITKGLAFVPVADSILGVPSDTGIQLDDKGRVILHKELRNAFGINNKVVVVRGFGCIQIWGSEGFHKLICSQDAWFQKAPLEYLP